MAKSAGLGAKRFAVAGAVAAVGDPASVAVAAIASVAWPSHSGPVTGPEPELEPEPGPAVRLAVVAIPAVATLAAAVPRPTVGLLAAAAQDKG